MEKYTLQLVVPSELRGIKQEVEKIQSYGDKQVFLSVSGVCDDIKSFQEWAQRKEVPDFVLVFGRIVNARINKESAREELLSVISDLCFNGSKIICILSEEEQEELLLFVNELIKLDLQNFYFATAFRTEDLIEWIFGNKTLQDNVPYVVRQTRPIALGNKVVESIEKEIPVEVEVIKEVPVEIEKEVIREVTIEVEREVIREVPVEKIVEREVIREVPIEIIVEKQVMVPMEAKWIGRVMIGIFNLAHGAGATTTAIEVAEQLHQRGYEVAVITMDDKVDLHYLNKKHYQANYIVPERGEKEMQFLDACRQTYDFILLDFGNLFDISPMGVLKAESLSNKEFEFREFDRCTYKIGVGFADDWNIGKLQCFIDNSDKPVFEHLDTFLFMIRGLASDQLAKRYNLNFCSDTDAVLHVLLEWLGLQKSAGKDKKTFPFLWK